MSAHITERRDLDFEGVEWRVTVFDDGQFYLLIVTTADGASQVCVHFDADQWAKFQKLVSP